MRKNLHDVEISRLWRYTRTVLEILFNYAIFEGNYDSAATCPESHKLRLIQELSFIAED